MPCLETNGALDPERDGHDYIQAFLNRHRDRLLFLPTVWLWEVLRGPAKPGDGEACRRTAGCLEFGFHRPFDAGAARRGGGERRSRRWVRQT